LSNRQFTLGFEPEAFQPRRNGPVLPRFRIQTPDAGAFSDRIPEAQPLISRTRSKPPSEVKREPWKSTFNRLLNES
jgi:hypothetical protein